MTHTDVGRGTWSMIIAVLLSAAASLAAAPASADQTDDAFIAALANQGIPIDSNTAIQMGRNMCALLDQGTKRPLLVMKMMKDANLSARQAGFFVGVSTSAYCPQYRSTAG